MIGDESGKGDISFIGDESCNGDDSFVGDESGNGEDNLRLKGELGERANNIEDDEGVG